MTGRLPPRLRCADGGAPSFVAGFDDDDSAEPCLACGSKRSEHVEWRAPAPMKPSDVAKAIRERQEAEVSAAERRAFWRACFIACLPNAMVVATARNMTVDMGAGIAAKHADAACDEADRADKRGGW